ncbi:MAG TPA: FecR family protein [Methylomirabilota bacterium]|nr:FecR family protein [Methylomirabilota bacterium]
MRISFVSLAFAVVATLGPTTAAVGTEPDRLIYDIVDVKRKLFEETGAEPRRLVVGDRAVSGDRLRTGSSSRAELQVASHATRFLLGPKTRCTLAHERPGVLLHVERGRLRAIFDAFTGADERLVTTPSAVLAVRGTTYGVAVARDGDTELVVFAGVVEVLDPAGVRAPVRVEAGELTRIAVGRPPEAPRPHRTAPENWDRGRTTPPPEMGSGFHGDSPAGPPDSPGAGAAAGSKGGSKRHGG